MTQGDENKGVPLTLDDVKTPPSEAVGSCRVFHEPIAGVPCTFLNPPDAAAHRQIIFLHGGAFTNGPIICHWGMLARVCEKTRMPAVMVDYGLLPERPFPAGLNDVLHVYHGLRKGGRRKELVLMGDSAGGGLALSATLALKDQVKAEGGAPRVKDMRRLLPEKLVLLSPWLDLTLSNPEIEAIREYEQLLRKEGLIEIGRQYANGRDPAHYLLSPLNGDLTGLPPTLLLIGTHDILVCDCRRFREKARAAGIELTYQEWEEMFHGWMTLTPQMPEANRAVEEIVGFLLR